MDTEATSLKERFAKVESKVDMLMNDMYNGNNDGVKMQLSNLVTKLDTRDEEQSRNLKLRDDERENRQKRRDFWIVTVVSILALTVAILTFLEARKQVKDGDLHLPKITSSLPEQYAHSKQPIISGGFDPLNAQQKGQ